MVTQFNIEMIDGYVLSPCQIYWLKRNGERTLVAQRGNFINHELITKLLFSQQVLEVEEMISSDFRDEVVKTFGVHRSEIQVKAKLLWRQHLLCSFKKHLWSGDKNQFELDLVMWKVFSKFDSEQTQSFLDKDIDLYKRSVSVASSYTLIAFILGYYHDEFLEFIFNQVFSDLFEVSDSEPLMSLKENLEHLREKENLSVDEKELLSRYYSQKQHLFNERFDGSGPLEVHRSEMSDLDLLLVALNRHFSFRHDDASNILCQMREGKFKCDEKISHLVLKTLEKQKEPEVIEPKLIEESEESDVEELSA